MEQENRTPVEDTGDNACIVSEMDSSDDGNESSVSRSSGDYSGHDEVVGHGILEVFINEASNANTRQEHDRDGWRTAEFIKLFNSRAQNTNYRVTSSEMKFP